MVILILQQIIRILSRVKKALSGVMLILLSAYVAGVIGFHFIEGLDWIDSAYFTFVTLSTIGFGDITPATVYGKLLVIIIAIFGVASFAIAITSIIQSMVSERMNRIFGLINTYLTNHVVICGWNESAKAAVEELLASTKKRIVIIDNKIERLPLEDPRVEFIKGDYKDRRTLIRAGIDRASDAIVVTGDDSDTVLTVLQIRAQNKDVHIAAELRGNSELERILKQAGANHVINSLSFGGRLLATSVSQPGTAFIFDDLSSTGAGNDIYEVKIPTKLVGKTFNELMLDLKRSINIMPIAIRKGESVMINPPLTEKVSKGDFLIIIATPDEYEKLKKIWKI